MIVEWDLKSESTPRCMTTIRIPSFVLKKGSRISNPQQQQLQQQPSSSSMIGSGGGGRLSKLNHTTTTSTNNNKNNNNHHHSHPTTTSTNPFDHVIMDTISHTTASMTITNNDDHPMTNTTKGDSMNNSNNKNKNKNKYKNRDNNNNNNDDDYDEDVIGLLYGTERGSWHYRIYQKTITTKHHPQLLSQQHQQQSSSPHHHHHHHSSGSPYYSRNTNNPTTSNSSTSLWSSSNNNNNNNNNNSSSQDTNTSWVLLSHLSADSPDDDSMNQHMANSSSNDLNHSRRGLSSSLTSSSSYPIVGMISSSSSGRKKRNYHHHPTTTNNNNPYNKNPTNHYNNNNNNDVTTDDGMMMMSSNNSNNNSNNNNSMEEDVEEVMIWVDDHRGPSSQSGAYPAHFLSIRHHPTRTHITPVVVVSSSSHSSYSSSKLRVSTATYSRSTGFVYAAGTMVQSVSSDILPSQALYPIQFRGTRLPNPGARSGSGMSLICQHRVAIVAVGNSFYAIPSTTNSNNSNTNNNSELERNNDALKLASFAQSSQVHPAIVVSLEDTSSMNSTTSTSSSSNSGSCMGTIFLANGRECAALTVEYHPDTTSSSSSSSSTTTDVLSASPPIHGMAQLPSPILSAVAVTSTSNNNHNNNNNSYSKMRTTYVACLTSDGLIQFRSPSCIAIPLKTMEIGNRPVDYYFLSSLSTNYQYQQHQQHTTNLLAGSYSGRIKYIWEPQMFPESKRVTADRLMKLSIDALGPNGFPRTQLANALQATFSATNYNNILASNNNNNSTVEGGISNTSNSSNSMISSNNNNTIITSTTTSTTTSNQMMNQGLANKQLLLQYLKAGLGLTELQQQQHHHHHHSHSRVNDTNAVHNNNNNNIRNSTSLTWTDLGWQEEPPSPTTNTTTNTTNMELLPFAKSTLLCGTALLTLLCSSMVPPQSSLALRAAKACATQIPISTTNNNNNHNNTNTNTIHSNNSSNHKDMDVSCVQVCSWVADKLVSQSKQNMIDLSSTHHPSFKQNNSKSSYLDFIETAVWLLRSCGEHSTAMQIWSNHYLHPTTNNNNSNSNNDIQKTYSSSLLSISSTTLKHQSYTANHLAELWSSHHPPYQMLVLETQKDIITHLLEDNAQLGLSVFTMTHPQNESQWKQQQQQQQQQDEYDPLLLFHHHHHTPQLSMQVVQLLKSIQPKQNSTNFNTTILPPTTTTTSKQQKQVQQIDPDPNQSLPLTTGRALAITYLESVTGISTNRPIYSTYPSATSTTTTTTNHPWLSNNMQSSSLSLSDLEEGVLDVYDELSYLLLEGIIAERNANNEEDSMLGWVYRAKLRRLLSWPNAKLRSERLLRSLPTTSFQREQALLLGRLGRHDDALRILYNDLQSLDLALQYCDSIHNYRLQANKQQQQQQQQSNEHNQYHTNNNNNNKEVQSCAYLPLVRVALDLDNHGEKGITAAIQVLSLRRSSIDRAAALRMLPKNVPLSAVARPFLIPAMIDGESQVRRLTVAASLLRAKYLHLKRKLTEAQIQSQATITSVPAFQTIPLGDLIYSSKPFRVRPLHILTNNNNNTNTTNNNTSNNNNNNNFPDITIIKHFFHRYLILQAKITNVSGSSSSSSNNNNNNNNNGGRTLSDVSFVVAESSDEALLPSLVVALPTLPSKVTGSCWCVLATSPQRLDGATAILTCELRYSLTTIDTVTGAPLNFTSSSNNNNNNNNRSYVEELQDLEIHRAEFEM